MAKILLVDDDNELREVTALILRGLGYDVATAADGGIAWSQWQKAATQGTPFCLVITDFEMPHLNGLALIALLDRDMLGCTTPVILTSADPPARFHATALRALLRKPSSLMELCTLVQHMRDWRASNPPCANSTPPPGAGK